MQTKPLIHCADYKGIMIKLMLCVIAVLSLVMFIPQEVEAGNCPNCTCDPGAPGRAEWSFDNDYSWACASRDWGDACETNCGGHEYPQGPGTVNPVETPYGYAAEYEEWEYETTFFVII